MAYSRQTPAEIMDICQKEISAMKSVKTLIPERYNSTLAIAINFPEEKEREEALLKRCTVNGSFYLKIKSPLSGVDFTLGYIDLERNLRLISLTPEELHEIVERHIRVDSLHPTRQQLCTMGLHPKAYETLIKAGHISEREEIYAHKLTKIFCNYFESILLNNADDRFYQSECFINFLCEALSLHEKSRIDKKPPADAALDFLQNVFNHTIDVMRATMKTNLEIAPYILNIYNTLDIWLKNEAFCKSIRELPEEKRLIFLDGYLEKIKDSSKIIDADLSLSRRCGIHSKETARIALLAKNADLHSACHNLLAPPPQGSQRIYLCVLYPSWRWCICRRRWPYSFSLLENKKHGLAKRNQIR